MFGFKDDDVLDSRDEFSVNGYEYTDVKYVYLNRSQFDVLKSRYANLKNLPAALQSGISSYSATYFAGSIKVAYLTATSSSGQVYIYRVAEVAWNGTYAESIIS